MLIWPLLDIVIPAHPKDQVHLRRLLESIQHQSYPKNRLSLHVITQGNSEEAKAIGIHACRGDVVGMVCTDNVLLEPTFLEIMVKATLQPTVVGAYTKKYAWVKEDTSLSRYFALIGANDPLCWWIGKADRRSYFKSICEDDETRTYSTTIPSLGDNGCFFKRQAIQLVTKNPKAFGSCMCICEDLKTLGFNTWAITPNTIWHRSGESLKTYLAKRWRYVNALYFAKYPMRRWHLVATYRDWALSLLFAIASVLVVPQVFISLRGYRSKPDIAWAWHASVCLALTLLYTCLYLKSVLSFPHWIGRKN